MRQAGGWLKRSQHSNPSELIGMCVHASLIAIKHAMQLKCTEALFVLDHSVRRIPTFLFRLSRVDVSAQMCSDNAACF